ncbi:hypothetical protein PVAND_005304 [Polypedilum vanderplanki]|uniref:Uncharacterized protein n=1 Tax=Polypedilum vanderplanki TaxID=319348 RepID=A0A9J6BZS0_POLVA|nr:hypothetical protein PVAND_005304 [Polypedilum vanderplanki]
MRIFNVETFCESISPIYIISKILGQVPYGFIRSNKRVLLKFSAFSVIYSLLCYALYCAALYYFVIENLRFNYYENYPSIGLIGNVS